MFTSVASSTLNLNRTPKTIYLSFVNGGYKIVPISGIFAGSVMSLWYNLETHWKASTQMQIKVLNT